MASKWFEESFLLIFLNLLSLLIIARLVLIQLISLVETGTKALSLSKAIELADVLKVSMDVLFQDNRLQQEESDIAEAAFLLQGCNSYEKEVIVDTIFALKTAMREHKRK